MNSESPNTDVSYKRHVKNERNTKETNVKVEVNIDGTGLVNVRTGYPFLDHLVSTFGKHSMTDINLEAKSNDKIFHHLIEDVGISIGRALNNALSDRTKISRFGYATIPMDESLAVSSIDLIKRQYSKSSLALTRKEVEGIPKEDLEHFIESFLQNLNACIHLYVQYGENDHHKIEAAIKALALAFRMAARIDSKQSQVPSTKGVM